MLQGINDVRLGKDTEEYSKACQAMTQDMCASALRRSTPVEEAEKNAAHHAEQHYKAQRAQKFLMDNPSFNEFIQLIREGVIGI